MAKKKNKTTPAAAASPTSSAAAVATAAPAADAIDRAYAAGNYAAVRRLAASTPSEHAKKLLSLVVVDAVQVLIGAGALFVVALAAFLTLR